MPTVMYETEKKLGMEGREEKNIKGRFVRSVQKSFGHAGI